MAEPIYSPGTIWAGLPHLSPLVVAVVVAIIAGGPLGWIGFLLPLGPLLAFVGPRLVGRHPSATWRLALAFSVVCAVLIGGSWTLMRVGQTLPPAAILFPLALLAFLLGLVNFVLVSISRAVRAWRSMPLHYPWIPGWLDGPLGLTATLKES
ncbi:MAG: hypothetical protein AAF467_07505 [Actinomycetota bacterium]